MESAQRELVSVLLNHLRSLGLISERACSQALELAGASTNLPVFFRDPAEADKEAARHDGPSNPQ